MKESYWGKYWRKRVSRRRVLAGGATLAAGSAAILAGCGDDDDDDDTGGDTGGGTTADPTATAAATQAADTGGDTGSEDQASDTGSQPEPEDRSKYGGKFNWTERAYPTGFDPSITITFPYGMAQTYSQLMAFSIIEDQFYPDAAQSWEQVDSETLVFNLRPGVRFNPEASDGREVTSEDWFTSLRRYPDSRANRGSNVNELFFSFMDENQGATFDTPDDLTLRINQNKPFSSNLRAFAAASLVVVSPERLAAEESGDLGQVSGVNAGTGPYMFDDVSETRITLKRNPNYYEHPEQDLPGTRFVWDHPYIDEMEAVIITDGAAAQSRFLAGDADYYGGIDKITAEQWEGQPNVNIVTGPAIDDGSRMIQLAAAKWTPYPELSKALSMAMDWDGYIDVVLGGEGRRSAPVSPTAFPNYALTQEEIKSYQVYDPQGARQLWEANNGPEIFPELDTTVPAWVADYPNTQFIGQSFEDSLGVKVNYNPLELATFIASANGPTGTKDWHFFIAGNNAVATMPDWNALVAYTPDGYGAIWGGNWYKGVNISDPWVNPDNPNYAETGGTEKGEAVRAALEITHPYARELQDYADRQAATFDDEERAEILKDMQRRIFTRYCCTLPLPTGTTKYQALGSRLKGLAPPPDGDQTAAFGIFRAHNTWLEG
ncbi:MAG: ABC transporter substrate-binding protein [Dehalococcoidia bacterium]|nr:ABC transporter substrate-binding protein [Dehalococcoidia bacterium]